MREELKYCPVCEETSFEKAVDTVDYSTSKQEFTVQKCIECSHLFTSPRVVEAEIGPYYDSPNYISHTNESKSLFGQVYQVMRGVNLRRKLSYVNAVYNGQGTVLDYGCGTGQFLQILVQSGKKSVGVEINDNARAAAQSYGSVSASIEGVEKGVEVITMWHVLEHIYDLNGLITSFKERLIAGGHLIIAVPNPESYDAEHYGKHWAAWDVPIHVHHFTEKSVSKLLGKHSFYLQKVIPMNMDSYYISLLSEQYKSGRKNKALAHWVKALYRGFISNVKAGKTNTSSNIYVFKHSGPIDH
tara:strand:- start:2433 stop:3332 length:900 start_codon:yes stop_codon:yes gene_type:complete